MSLQDRLKDPWGALMGFVAGGLAWAVIPGAALAIPIGLGVGAVVYGAKVASGALVARTEDPPAAGPRPRRGSPAEVWVNRAERAGTNLEHLVESSTPGPLKEQLQSVEQQAEGTISTIRRLSSQVAAVEQGMERIPISQIQSEQRRLAAAIATSTSPEVRQENSKALASVDTQAASYGRLLAARDALVARMESAALGLEGINARTAEVLAMSATSATVEDWGGDGMLGELNDELESLRVGLAASEEYTRKVLRPGDTS